MLIDAVSGARRAPASPSGARRDPEGIPYLDTIAIPLTHLTLAWLPRYAHNIAIITDCGFVYARKNNG